MPNRWSKNAQLRKSQIESGLDITFSKVFIPLYEAMIRKLNPKRILEVGAGTGHLANALSPYPDEYLAIEPSEGMFEVAEQVLRSSKAILRPCTLEGLHEKIHSIQSLLTWSSILQIN